MANCAVCCASAPRWRRAAMRARSSSCPESAHGTNPATAAFAGYRVEDIPGDRRRPGRSGGSQGASRPRCRGCHDHQSQHLRPVRTRHESDFRRGPCRRAASSIATVRTSTPSSARCAPATSASMRCTSICTRPSPPRMAAADRVPARWCCPRRSRPMARCPSPRARRRRRASGRGRKRRRLLRRAFRRTDAALAG